MVAFFEFVQLSEQDIIENSRFYDRFRRILLKILYGVYQTLNNISGLEKLAT